MRECKVCNQPKQEEDFYKTKAGYAKYKDKCKGCAKVEHKAYEKTHKGFLMRMYRNMQSRITGVQRAKHHLYKGKSLLSREEFYTWAFNSPEFFRLFKLYEDSGYDRKLSPSVDRVNSAKGYSIDNMEWVNHSINSSRGTITDWDKKQSIIANAIINSDSSKFTVKPPTKWKEIVKLTLDGGILGEYKSCVLGARSEGRSNSSHVAKICQSGGGTAYGFKWVYKSDYNKQND